MGCSPRPSWFSRASGWPRSQLGGLSGFPPCWMLPGPSSIILGASLGSPPDQLLRLACWAGGRLGQGEAAAGIQASGWRGSGLGAPLDRWLETSWWFSRRASRLEALLGCPGRASSPAFGAGWLLVPCVDSGIGILTHGDFLCTWAGVSPKSAEKFWVTCVQRGTPAPPGHLCPNMLGQSAAQPAGMPPLIWWTSPPRPPLPPHDCPSCEGLDRLESSAGGQGLSAPPPRPQPLLRV